MYFRRLEALLVKASSSLLMTLRGKRNGVAWRDFGDRMAFKAPFRNLKEQKRQEHARTMW